MLIVPDLSTTDVTSSLLKLPIEIVKKIISQLDINSTNFLLDFINILLAIDTSNQYNNDYYQDIIKMFSNEIVVMDLTSTNSNNNNSNSNNENTVTPLLTVLRRNFLLDIDKLNSTDYHSNENTKESLIYYKNLVLIIDDSLLLMDDTLIEFESIFTKLTNNNAAIDIIYCPNDSNNNHFSNCSILKLLKQLDPIFQNFNNLILEFPKQSIQTNRNFFDILNYDFFIESDDINSKTIKPRCNKITFPSIIELNMDYLTIDSFIFKILDEKSETFINKFFTEYLKNLEFYLPNLQTIKFRNYNNEETCNFIDLSSLMLKKFTEKSCPLKYLFELHSFKNWNSPNLKNFTGHRFKYDESKISSSVERMKRSLSDNIKLLHKIAMNETSDATPYFRVSLIPPGVKHTKIINWLPSNSPNSFRLLGLNIDTQNSFDLNDMEDEGDYYDSNSHNTAPSDLSERTHQQNYFNKPILCLTNDSITSLELKLLTINKNSKSIYIQGLFMKNLKELIIQNFTTITKRAKISDKRNSIVLLSPSSSNQNRITPVPSNNGIDLITDTSDIDDIHPIGFSSWNNLPSCEFIRFSTQQKVSADKILPIESTDKKQINLLFKIKNLKQVLPKINLNESFNNFIDERQRYIIV